MIRWFNVVMVGFILMAFSAACTAAFYFIAYLVFKLLLTMFGLI